MTGPDRFENIKKVLTAYDEAVFIIAMEWPTMPEELVSDDVLDGAWKELASVAPSDQILFANDKGAYHLGVEAPPGNWTVVEEEQ